MLRLIASVMLLPMNNGPPISTDDALARQDSSPIQADDREAMPGGGMAAPDETPTITLSLIHI